MFACRKQKQDIMSTSQHAAVHTQGQAVFPEAVSLFINQNLDSLREVTDNLYQSINSRRKSPRTGFLHLIFSTSEFAMDTTWSGASLNSTLRTGLVL